MLKTKICSDCERLLEEAVVAIRQHEAHMHKGVELNVTGYLTEDLRRKLAPGVVETFKAAQVSWDVYRQHLIEHGLLTRAGKATQST